MRHWQTLLALMAYMAIEVQAAKNVTVHASDASQISYFGSGWRSYSDCGGTMFSYAIGDSFSFSFIGTDVYLFGTIGTTGGVATVTMDSTRTQVDRLDTASYLCGELLYSSTNMFNTRHDITMNFTSQSPGLSEGYIDWQWIQYTVPDDVTSTPPFSYPGTATTSSNTAARSSTGLPSAGGSTPEEKKSTNMPAIIGGIAGGLGALVIFAALLFLMFRRKKAKKIAKQAEQMANSLPPGPSPMSFTPNQAMSNPNLDPSRPPQVPIPTQQHSHAGFRGDHKSPIAPDGYVHGSGSSNGHSLPVAPYGNYNYTGSESGAVLIGHQQSPATAWPAQESLSQPHSRPQYQLPYGNATSASTTFAGAASSSTVNVAYQQPLAPVNHYPMGPLPSVANSSAYGPPPGLAGYSSRIPITSTSTSSHSGSGSGTASRSEKSRHVANPEPAAPAPAYSASGPLGEAEVNRIAARVVESLRAGGPSSGPSGSSSSALPTIPDLENDPGQIAANIREAAAGRYDAPPTYDNKR